MGWFLNLHCWWNIYYFSECISRLFHVEYWTTQFFVTNNTDFRRDSTLWAVSPVSAVFAKRFCYLWLRIALKDFLCFQRQRRYYTYTVKAFKLVQWSFTVSLQISRESTLPCWKLDNFIFRLIGNLMYKLQTMQISGETVRNELSLLKSVLFAKYWIAFESDIVKQIGRVI